MRLNAWARSILSLSLLALPGLAAELRVDHVTYAGSDLVAMTKAMEDLGFKVEYGGPHSNHATEMAIVSFDDGSYLELIAPQKNGDPAAIEHHYWSKYMRGNAGPCAWAVRSPDIGAEVARLKAAGAEVSAPHQSGRARPDGVRLDWETATVGTATQGSFFPFLIRDVTPRNKRAFPGGLPGNRNFAGVTQVVISVADLDASSARFSRAYGIQGHRVMTQGARPAIVFPGTPVLLNLDPQRVARFGEGVSGIGVTPVGSKPAPVWIVAPQ